MKQEPRLGDLPRQAVTQSEPGWNPPGRNHAVSFEDLDDSRGNERAQGPLVPGPEAARAHASWREPVVDAALTTVRIPLRSPVVGGGLHVPSVFLSLAIHVAGALLAVVGVDLSFLEKPREEQIVEVTFGLEVPSRVNAAPPPKTVDPAVESPPQPDQGTKLPEQLPQLPERFDINTKQPEPVAEDLPAPEQPTELEQPVATPVAKPEPTPLPATPAPDAIVAEERDKDARKIDMKDVIDRMKREDRKVADKDKEGPNKIPDSPLSKPSDLPPNPLADTPIPNMPDALAPSGSLAGRKLAGSALEAYRTAALVHMKRNWNIPGVYSFSADIEAVAVVVVDLFGKIRSLEIDKSSGNVAFDEVVLKQIQAAEPFPDFPDDSARTQKIYMKFKPQSID